MDAQKKLDDCRGTYLLKKIEKLKDTQYIFERNYSDLKTHFEKFTDDEYFSSIVNCQDDTARTEIHLNTSRYLFNYLSSAVALREHTNKFMKEFEKTEFDSIATKYVSDNIPIGINDFIKELRNYLIHFNIPRHSMQFTVKEITPDKRLWYRELTLNSRDLLSDESFRWNENSIEYIESNLSFKSVSIEKLSNDYYKLISEYYDWFFKTFLDSYREEFDEYYKLKSDYDNKSMMYYNRQRLTRKDL